MHLTSLELESNIDGQLLTTFIEITSVCELFVIF